MAKQIIGIGSAPNDGTGDPLRTAFSKVNDNFDEVYTSFVMTGQLTVGNSTVNTTISNTGGLRTGNSTTSATVNSTAVQLAGFAGTSTLTNASLVFGSNVTANQSTFFVGNSTVNSSMTATGVTVGQSAINSTAVAVGSNVVINSSAYYVGNSTVNSSLTSSNLRLGNTVVNSTVVSVGSNVVVNSSAISVGNSTSNIVITQTGLTGDVTIAGNLTVTGTVTSVNTSTLDVTDINITIAKNAANSAVADGAGITIAGANATINYVDSTNNITISHAVTLANTLTVGTATVNSTNYSGTANNATNLGGVAAASYVQNTDSRTLSGNLAFTGANNVFGANTTFNGYVIATDDVVITRPEGRIVFSGPDIPTSNNFMYIERATAGGEPAIEFSSSNNTNTYFRYGNNGILTIWTLDGSGSIVVGNSTVNASMNASSFTGTANNASYLGTIAAANFVANTQGALTQNSSGHFIVANTGIVANAAGLFVNAAYINTIAANSATYVLANDGIVSNSSGVFVNVGTGIVVNSVGVHVNSAYINTIAANSATYVLANDGIISNSSGVFVNSGTSLTVNSIGVHVNSAYINTIAANSATYVLANDGIVSNSSGVFVNVGTGLTVNATGVHVNGSYIQNTDSRVLSGNIQFTGTNNVFTANTLTIGSSTLAANGYTYLPNGLKMVWGTVSANSTDGNVSFTSAFSTALYSITATGTNTEVTMMPAVVSSNTTEARIYTSNATSVNVYFTAIGL